MRSFVAILLVIFATGVGLLTYIAAGGRVADLVGEDVALMLPFDLDFLRDDKDDSSGLPVPEISSESTLGQAPTSESPELGVSVGIEANDASQPGGTAHAEGEAGVETIAPAAGSGTGELPAGQGGTVSGEATIPNITTSGTTGSAAGGQLQDESNNVAAGEPGLPEGPFKLSLPLDCEYGKNCFIQ